MVGGTYEKAIFTQTSRSSTLHGNFGRHKLARWDGNRAGILELVPQVEWARTSRMVYPRHFGTLGPVGG